MINLFDDLPARAHQEIVTELLLRQGVRIERIVSTGQSTPADKPYNQDHDEWVLLLTGSAGLWIDGEGERDLRPGDHVLIPAHCLHRVTRTANSEPTVWLAVHLGCIDQVLGCHRPRKRTIEARTGEISQHRFVVCVLHGQPVLR
jgi:cupin 2 domain-containing protein